MQVINRHCQADFMTHTGVVFNWLCLSHTDAVHLFEYYQPDQQPDVINGTLGADSHQR